MKILPALRSLFFSAAALGAMGACTRAPLELPQAEQAVTQTDLTRPLTANEAQLVKSIFGPNFDTDTIRIRLHPEADNTRMAVLNGNQTDIEVFGRDNYSDDFTQSSTRVSVFMHEVAHLRQNREVDGRLCRARYYTLAENSRFSDFCVEQQGEIIEDYIDLYIYQSNIVLMDPLDFAIENFSYESIGWLAEVVEAEFPSARDARMAANNARVAAGIPTISEIFAPPVETAQPLPAPAPNTTPKTPT